MTKPTKPFNKMLIMPMLLTVILYTVALVFYIRYIFGSSSSSTMGELFGYGGSVFAGITIMIFLWNKTTQGKKYLNIYRIALVSVLLCVLALAIGVWAYIGGQLIVNVVRCVLGYFGSIALIVALVKYMYSNGNGDSAKEPVVCKQSKTANVDEVDEMDEIK